MSRHTDRRAGRQDGERPALVGESIKDYFAPEKSGKTVLRGELGSLFVRFREAEKARRWYRRWWTAIKRWVRPAVDLIDFLHVLREEDAAVRAIAKDANIDPKPL